MSASSIGAGRGGGYARYLEGKTIAPEQGDYYLTPDGELTEAPGHWLSDRETLARLGIDPDAPVDGAQFIALMEGRDQYRPLLLPVRWAGPGIAVSCGRVGSQSRSNAARIASLSACS
jgi:hypothetical protein